MRARVRVRRNDVWLAQTIAVKSIKGSSKLRLNVAYRQNAALHRKREKKKRERESSASALILVRPVILVKYFKSIKGLKNCRVFPIRSLLLTSMIGLARRSLRKSQLI